MSIQLEVYKLQCAETKNEGTDSQRRWHDGSIALLFIILWADTGYMERISLCFPIRPFGTTPTDEEIIQGIVEYCSIYQ